jgi:autotransporter translocation and assembly factor TamB
MEISPLDLGGKTREQPPRWWRWVSIGCAVVVLALVLALVGGVLSSRRMMVWGVGRLADRVIATLPQGTPPTIRNEMRRQFDCVVQAARERRVSEQRLGEFARACVDALADKSISADEEARLGTLAIGICREAAGDVER